MPNDTQYTLANRVLHSDNILRDIPRPFVGGQRLREVSYEAISAAPVSDPIGWQTFMGTIIHINFSEKRENNRPEIIAQINGLLETSCLPNWDGQGGKPVSEELTNMAFQIVNQFPKNIPVPDVSASPMGYIRLDWILEDEFDTRLIMAISPDSVIHYVYNCDDDDEQFDGKQKWTGKLAESVDCLLNKLA